MKPTSFIFLALAAILLFSGWMTCSIAQGMAKSQGIQIFEQKKVKNGDTVYKYELSDEKLSKLNLTFSDVDVQIIGDQPKSYIELRNFDPYDYTTTLTGSTVTVDGTAGGLSSLIDMSGGGFKFKGLRYFFADKPAKGHKKSVTVYLSASCDITSLNLTLQEGSVTLKSLYNPIDYNLNVSGGNISIDTVETKSIISLSLSAGDLTINNSDFATLSATTTGGKVDIISTKCASEFISYNIKSATSTLNYNGTAIEDGQLKQISPSAIQKTLIKLDATDAVITITDSASSESATE